MWNIKKDFRCENLLNLMVIFSIDLQYIFCALRDCTPQLRLCSHEDTSEAMVEAFDKEIMGTLKEVNNGLNWLIVRLIYLLVE